MIHILLSTYNGEKYLEEQLESLINQKGVEFKILVRDDGSTDGTIDILNKWQNNGLLTWYSGENIGVVNSFMDLLKKAPKSDYYAFCDQDDVWLPNKLEESLERIQKFSNEEPSLVCSDLIVVNKDLNVIHKSMWEYMKLRPKLLVKFYYAISCNLFTGCTMVFNNAAKELFFPATNNILMHDSWLGLKIIANNGNIGYIHKPLVLYRQHGNNVCGVNYVNNSITYYIHKILSIKKIFINDIKKYKMAKDATNMKIPIYKFLFYRIAYVFKRI